MSRVTDPADPNRCKGVAPDGQCWNEALHGSDFCKAHRGVSTEDEEGCRSLLLAKMTDRMRLAQLRELDPIAVLNDNLKLHAILTERVFNKLSDEDDWVRNSGELQKLFLTTERLAKTLTQLKKSTGELLEKPAIFILGQSIIKIVIDELVGVPEYEDRVDRITSKMIRSIEVASNKVEQTTND